VVCITAGNMNSTVKISLVTAETKFVRKKHSSCVHRGLDSYLWVCGSNAIDSYSADES
jgi:hypothetical protein